MTESQTLTETDRERAPRPVRFTTTTFRIYRSRDGWRWRAVRANGRIMADSGEAYTRKVGARRAVWRFIAAIDRENIRVAYED